jgi:hypothetical protein
MRELHRTLCFEYKNAISLEEENAQYAVIRCWWYSLGATHEVELFENCKIGSFFSTFVSNNGEDL